MSRANVTVAVSTMNRPAALARCVSAILAGDTLPSEIVIVDQGAQAAFADPQYVVSGFPPSLRPNSAELRRGHAIARLRATAGSRTGLAVDPRDPVVPVRYVRQTQRGLAASRNAAIATASQPIVVFTDDDCVPDDRWLTAIVAAFDGPHHPDGVTGRVLPLGPEQPGLYPVSTRASRVRAIYRGRSLPWAVGSGGNVAVKRAWLDRIGGFDERLGAGSAGRSAEDMDLFYRLLRAGATLKYEPDAIVFHERKDAAGRLATRPSYGFGMGAFCALSLRRHDAYACRILAHWCFDRGFALLAACVRQRWRRVLEELLMLRGAASGIAYGLTCSNSVSNPVTVSDPSIVT